MERTYCELEMEVIRFTEEDVITESYGNGESEGNL